ncbi:MAG: hypothetical protein NVS3B3_21340 [Aquirhabdus sp.]
MKGMEDYGTLILLLIGITVLLGIFVVALIRSLRFIFSEKERRKIRFKRVAKIYAKRMVIVVVASFSLNYLMHAYMRVTASQPCEQSVSDDGLYAAQLCPLGIGLASSRVIYVLKIFSTGDKNLLAERSFSYSYKEKYLFLWSKSHIGYGDSDGDYEGVILLPPTLFDRLRAKLP